MSIRHNGAIIAGAGGGAEPDETTIDLNSSQKLEALGTKNKNTSSSIGQVFNWVGTLQEHTTQQIATLHPEWICYITDDTSAGRAPFFLFQFQYTDYILNEPGWVNADAFNWCSGATYSNAYTHLVNDISGITAETETIGSYTVTFYRATDGHKICLADQETTVSNIFSETGVAWYYILDTQNSRFKLPRTLYYFSSIRNSVGNLIEAGLPDIEGVLRFTTGTTSGKLNSIYPHAANGAFYRASTTISGVADFTASSSTTAVGIVNFAASKSNSIYSNSNTVQPLTTQMYLEFYLN